MRLTFIWNGHFHAIHNFSHLLPPKHLISSEISKICISWGGRYIGKFFEFFNFLDSFHTKLAKNDPQWQILPKKSVRLAQNGQFWSFCRFFPIMRLTFIWNGHFHAIHNFSHLLPPKHLISSEISKICISWGGRYIGKFFEFFNFLDSFHTKLAKNDPQWQILPKKSVRLAQNGQFWSSCRFFPIMRLTFIWNGHFHAIHNFSHLLPPKHLISSEISKICISWGGKVHRQIF